MGATDQSESPDPARVISWALLPGTFLFVARIAYEMALLPDSNLLFAFSHTHPVLATWGVISYYMTWLWLGVLLLKAAMERPRWKLLVDHRMVLSVLAALVAVGLIESIVLP